MVCCLAQWPCSGCTRQLMHSAPHFSPIFHQCNRRAYPIVGHGWHPLQCEWGAAARRPGGHSTPLICPAALQALLCLAGCDSELLTDTWLCSVCSVAGGVSLGFGRGFLVTALTPDGLSTLRPSLLSGRGGRVESEGLSDDPWFPPIWILPHLP